MNKLKHLEIATTVSVVSIVLSPIAGMILLSERQ